MPTSGPVARGTRRNPGGTNDTQAESAGAVWKGSRHAVRTFPCRHCLAGGRIIPKKWGQVKSGIGAGRVEAVSSSVTDREYGSRYLERFG